MSQHPYSYRILLAEPDSADAIEIHRSTAQLHPKVYRRVTADIDPSWRVIVEHRLRDRECITSRVTFKRASGAEKLKIHLTKEQKDKLYEND